LGKKQRKPRKPSDLKRKIHLKDALETFLIVCEAEKTEPIYFSHLVTKLDLGSVNVKILRKPRSNPLKIVEFALDTQENTSTSSTRTEYDKIWCVLDVESSVANKNLQDAIELAKSKRINIILSNPCFEYWYILHFERISPKMKNCKDAIRMLDRYIKDYRKNDAGIFNKVSKKTMEAIENSKSVFNNCLGNTVIECNPSTNVHELVEYLSPYVDDELIK